MTGGPTAKEAFTECTVSKTDSDEMSRRPKIDLCGGFCIQKAGSKFLQLSSRNQQNILCVAVGPELVALFCSMTCASSCAKKPTPALSCRTDSCAVPPPPTPALVLRLLSPVLVDPGKPQPYEARAKRGRVGRRGGETRSVDGHERSPFSALEQGNPDT